MYLGITIACLSCHQSYCHSSILLLVSSQAIHQATGISLETDLLYSSQEVEFQGLLPYYVALDRERQEVSGTRMKY